MTVERALAIPTIATEILLRGTPQLHPSLDVSWASFGSACGRFVAFKGRGLIVAALALPEPSRFPETRTK